MNAEAPATRRTGGRSALVLAAVRSAVEELLKEQGSDRLTVPLVAERAGVNPTSIYRRWGDLPTLINEVAQYRLDPNRPLPDTGDLREDLAAWARELVVHFSKPANASLLRAGAALADDGDRDCTRMRRNEALILVDRARARDAELWPEADQVINHIIAPITYRVIFAPSTMNVDIVDGLIDDLYRAIAARETT